MTNFHHEGLSNLTVYPCVSMPGQVTFTDNQNRAINHSKGHLRIVACSGSGKTEVVSNRVARLIERGVNPKTIVAFTFTDKAAEELKTRIRKILEERCPERSDFGDMFVGTIHSFCFFMLKEIDPYYRSFDVLDDPMRVAFLSKSKNYYEKLKLISLEKHHGLKRYKTINLFIESMEIVLTEGIQLQDISDERFARSAKAYLELLDAEKYFDFSTILHTFVKSMKESKSKRKQVGERVKHVIVDEYQDVNRVQEALVELLSEFADSVCVVGDDDQNIYNWRGSDVGFIRSFRERFKRYHVTDVHLDTNFRSTDAIVHTAKAFIEHNKRRLPKNMISNPSLSRKYEKGDIFHRHFSDDTEEFNFIRERINELLNCDFTDKRNRKFPLSYNDFAVLVRTNNDAARIVEYLNGNGIRSISYSGTSIFESPVTVLAME